MKKLRLLVLASLVAAFALSCATSGAPARCTNCMMKVRPDSPYMVTVSFADGSSIDVCSLYCASMEAERAGGLYTGMVVKDYLTGERIDAGDAAWVVGSDVRAMMSDESRIAFKDRDAATKFTAEHGGRVVGFGEAYDASVNEWKE